MNFDYEYLDNICNVFVDKTQTHGLLRFGHEINVSLVKENGKWKFDSAWHIGISDMEWNADEEENFNQTFPGLLAEMMCGLEQ